MAWSFNVFTSNLDQTGSGAVVFEGEVETFDDLPEAVGDPAIGASYLVRSSTGVWLVNRRQAGIWIRKNNTGVRATDWEYGGDYPVNSVNGQTGNVSLTATDVGASATGHIHSYNDLTDIPESFPPSSHAESHLAEGSDPLYDQDLSTTDAPTFAGLTAESWQSGSGQVLVQFEDNRLKIINENEWAVDIRAGLFGLRDWQNDYFGTFNSTNVLSGDRTYDLPDADGVLVLDSQLGAAATSNSYDDLDNLPTLGTAAAADTGDFAAASHSHSDATTSVAGFLSASDKTKLDGIASGAEVNVQADWNQSSNSADDFIKNKPTIPNAVSIDATAADILSVSSGAISADDLGADKIWGWDDSASKAIGFGVVGPTFDGTNLRWPVELVIACSDETTSLTAGNGKVTFRAPYAFLLTGVRASVNTAPTGSTLIVDINNGANSALSTKLSIDASEKTSTTAATAAVINTSYDDISDDAEITIDIDQIGSTVAGKGLKVTLIGTRA